VLVHLRKGETYAEITAGLGLGLATAWRYITETVALLARRAPKLDQALLPPRRPAPARRNAHPNRTGRRRPAVLLREEPGATA
jgi:hypothetical protein